MNKTKTTKARKVRRHARIRSQISGTASRPRLSVYKSTNGVYLQIIDDDKGVTLCATDTRKSKEKTPLDRAKDTGKVIAKLADDLKVKEVVFDRGGYEYKGKIQAVAEAAREGGLKF